MANHYLHQIVGDIILREFGEKVKRDFACCRDIGTREQLPLFSSKDKSRKTQLCKVDMLIIFNGEVKIIIEVEESGMIPTKICGKLLTSSLAKYYIPYKGERMPLANPFLFIQILDESRIPEGSSIRNQWCNMEEALQGIKKIKDREVSYKLIFGSPGDFKEKHSEELIGSINDFLKNN